MPRYLAINEIKTVLTFGKEPYHARFHSIFTRFIDSFIPTAHLISISGRNKLLPIVGFSNLYCLYSFWRFVPLTCKFNTSGPLPYPKHMSKPHHDVIVNLLRQNTPQYLMLTLMSLTRANKGRYHVFEGEFAKTIIETMELTEQMPQSINELLRIWNNLLSQLVTLIQLINLPSLMQQITGLLKLKTINFKVSRDWLMWFLLPILVLNQDRKTSRSEFTDLFEILYNEDEPLPSPDPIDFMAVIKLAPLANWINMNLKQATTDNNTVKQQTSGTGVSSTASNSNRTNMVPDLIKNHSILLQDCMKNLENFGYSICLNAYGSDSLYFSQPFNHLIEKIGKPSSQQSLKTNSIFTTHEPLSNAIIASLALNVRTHTASYLSYMLTQRAQTFKVN
jgi:hypothetical protein